MNPRWIPRLATALLALMMGSAAWFSTARAALSERGGSGVFEVQSAESKRPGRLELGIFGSAQRLDLQDVGVSRFNALTGGLNAGLGLPGGFEASGTVPAYGYYLTSGAAGLSLNDNIAVRLGDVAARLRWTHGFLGPGMRWGFEGEASFATGNDRIESYPGRTPTQPFTLGENAYTGRAMLTWDGLRAGSGVPIRLHANSAYTVVRDEGRFVLPHGPLPLELPAPARKGDNDVLSLGAAIELDLKRLTLFTEAVTDQLVNERGLLAARENRMVLTPGVRIWIPGGMSVAAAYSMDLSKDDARTAFDPRREFSDHEWRVALSLGTIYRGRRARAEDAAAIGALSPAPVATPAMAGVPGVTTVAEPPMVPDSSRSERAVAKREILERRPTQETPPTPAKTAGDVAGVPVVVAPTGAVRAARPANLVDTDGDGIPDVRDQCPLVPEDWDGFQDLDGCPDLDNDGDGIPDVRDACPNDPETYNGYYDFDGCPDGPGGKWIGSADRPEAGPGMIRDSVRASIPPAERPGVARAAIPARDTVLVMAPPVVARPTVALASAPPTARADSLAVVLDAERRYAAELATRLDRTEAERRELLARVMAPSDTAVRAVAPIPAARAAAPVPATPTPAPPLKVAANPVPEVPTTAPSRAEGEAIAALSARLERLERLERTPPVSIGGPTPGGATVVNVPRPTEGGTTIVGSDRDVSGRVAQIERELAELRSARRDVAPTPTPAAAEVPAPAAAPVPAAPAERNGAIERRFGTIESRIESLAVSSAPPPSSASAALETLLPTGVTRTFREVRFESNSTRLTNEAVVFLTRLAELLAAEPDLMVRITGHTDNYGEAEYNLHLSRERAATVARLLEAQAVAHEHMIVDGRGEDEPVATNATAAGREANRRVTFTRIR